MENGLEAPLAPLPQITGTRFVEGPGVPVNTVPPNGFTHHWEYLGAFTDSAGEYLHGSQAPRRPPAACPRRPGEPYAGGGGEWRAARTRWYREALSTCSP